MTHEGDSSAGIGHVVPLRILGAILAALIALTVLTVYSAEVDLGDFNIYVAMGIASLKALLVVLFFMHLKYEKPILAIIFGSTLLIVAIFISLAMVDTEEYEPSVQSLEKRIQETP